MLIEKKNPRLDGLRPEKLGELLSDQEWRLNNLYWIIDRFGKEVIFEMNSVQRKLWERRWHRNIILKARQHGVSTFIELFFLDTLLFHPNMKATVTADTKEHAKNLFKDKVKFAWDRLDPRVKNIIKAELTTVTKERIELSNGSEMLVSVSARSSTQQFVHISEYGKISVQDREKAREIKTGTFPTVPQSGFIFIESTAEGQEGEFYDMCQASMRKDILVRSGEEELLQGEFRFHFFPWYDEESYRVEEHEAAGKVIPKRLEDYFNGIEEKLGIHLSKPQRVWYMMTEDYMGEDMHREHPSYPEEAFMVSIKGAYFSDEMTNMRKEGRMVDELPLEMLPVHTFWDIGVNDTTAILFVQYVDGWFNVVDYYESSNQGVKHYADRLLRVSRDRNFVLGSHFGPHDLRKRSFQTGVTTSETALGYGIRFEEATRKPDRKIDAIEAARVVLPKTRICMKHCRRLINHLDNYRKDWNNKMGCWSDSPRHDEHSNGADAFQIFAANSDEVIRACLGHRRSLAGHASSQGFLI